MTNKEIDKIYTKFKKELSDNDKKVNGEIFKKSQEQKSKEFADFIRKNNCKIMKGGNDGK